MCTGVSMTAFLASVQWWNKKLRPVIERQLDSSAIMLFGVWVTFLKIIRTYCVARFSSFMYQTNCVCTGFLMILDMFTYVAPSSVRHITYHNRPFSQMRALLVACRELALDYDTFPQLLYVFGHKRIKF